VAVARAAACPQWPPHASGMRLLWAPPPQSIQDTPTVPKNFEKEFKLRENSRLKSRSESLSASEPEFPSIIGPVPASASGVQVPSSSRVPVAAGIRPPCSLWFKLATSMRQPPRAGAGPAVGAGRTPRRSCRSLSGRLAACQRACHWHVPLAASDTESRSD
jgi:hypothetical protein